jgi:DNA-binding response OmpR family regulator
MTLTASPRLRQLEHSHWPEHQIWYSDQQHLLIIDGVVLPCSLSEFDVLLTLLRAGGEPVSFARLVYRDEAQPIPLRTRHRLTQRVSRLRGRLWPLGLDILCLTGYGYLLLARPHLQAEGA